MTKRRIIVEAFEEFGGKHPEIVDELLRTICLGSGKVSHAARIHSSAEHFILTVVSDIAHGLQSKTSFDQLLRWRIESYRNRTFRNISSQGQMLLDEFLQCLMELADKLSISYNPQCKLLDTGKTDYNAR